MSGRVTLSMTNILSERFCNHQPPLFAHYFFNYLISKKKKKIPWAVPKIKKKFKNKFSIPLTIFFQFLKRLIIAHRKVPMLKHGHIRNQHTQIGEKKQIKKFPKKIPFTTFIIEKVVLIFFSQLADFSFFWKNSFYFFRFLVPSYYRS